MEGTRAALPRRVDQGGTHVLGPLPQLHRLLLITTVLVVGIASGAWIAHFTILPVAATVGAAVGGLAGVLLAYVLVHDWSHHTRAVRVRRH
jgi:hypothetical protein